MKREGDSWNQKAWHPVSKHFFLPKAVGVCHGNLFLVGTLSLGPMHYTPPYVGFCGVPGRMSMRKQSSAGSPGTQPRCSNGRAGSSDEIPWLLCLFLQAVHLNSCLSRRTFHSGVKMERMPAFSLPPQKLSRLSNFPSSLDVSRFPG